MLREAPHAVAALCAEHQAEIIKGGRIDFRGHLRRAALGASHPKCQAANTARNSRHAALTQQRRPAAGESGADSPGRWNRAARMASSTHAHTRVLPGAPKSTATVAPKSTATVAPRTALTLTLTLTLALTLTLT